MKTQIIKVGTSTPQVRFALKARIVGAGFKFYNEFARRIDTDPTRLSRILNGYEYPTRPVQKAICRELNITLRELKDLLNSGV